MAPKDKDTAPPDAGAGPQPPDRVAQLENQIRDMVERYEERETNNDLRLRQLLDENQRLRTGGGGPAPRPTRAGAPVPLSEEAPPDEEPIDESRTVYVVAQQVCNHCGKARSIRLQLDTEGPPWEHLHHGEKRKAVAATGPARRPAMRNGIPFVRR